MSEPRQPGFTPTKPTHNLCVAAKGAKYQQVGVGWLGEKGDILIRLNAHVVISEVQLRDCQFRLFLNQDNRKPQQHHAEDIGELVAMDNF